MYVRHEEAKILSLLHLFCETVVTVSKTSLKNFIVLYLFLRSQAAHVPAIVLQRAYSAVQHLFLLPLPVSATVKEVLDLIQIEMKSPGRDQV